MIAHQTIAMNDGIKSLPSLTNRIQKGMKIIVSTKNILPTFSAIHYVIKRMLILNPKRAYHKLLSPNYRDYHDSNVIQWTCPLSYRLTIVVEGFILV